MDNLRKETDKKLKQLEDEIERIYKDAEDELREKWDKYMQRAEKRLEGAEKELQKALTSGDADAIAAARASLARKKQAVLFQDNQYKDMIDGVTERMAHVNQIAAEYMNANMADIYRYNYNGTLNAMKTEANKAGIDGVAFNLLDESTVERMVKRGEVKLPAKKIDVPKDQQWNKKTLNSQLMQGIIQGESIPQMSKRFEAVTDMDKNAAIRNARTMTTEAENGGRMDSMHEAEEMGLEYAKVWMSTHDERTRESHVLMDGVAVPLDEPFILQNSDGSESKMMYPGDPNGAPEQVYNCRCSLVRKLVGYKGKSISAKAYEPTYFEEAQAEAAKAAPAAEPKRTASSWLQNETPLPPATFEYTNYKDFNAAKQEYIAQYGEDAYYNGQELREQHASEWGSLPFDKEEREKQVAVIRRTEDTVTRLQEKYKLPGGGKMIVGEYDTVQNRLSEKQQERADKSGALAQTWSVGDNDVVIGFIPSHGNKSFEDDLKNRQEKIDKGERLMSVFEEESAEGTAIHEYGHAMDVYFDNAFIYDDEDARAYWEWFKGLSEDEIKDGISAYAATNRCEFAAECFAELQTENPRPLAVKFGEYFDKVYKKDYATKFKDEHKDGEK